MSKRVNLLAFAAHAVGISSLFIYFGVSSLTRAADVPANVRTELTTRFRELDKNQDDALSKTELGTRLFEFLDANRDDQVLLEEVFGVVRDKGLDALKAVAENQAAPEPEATLEPLRQGPQRLVPGDHQIGRMIPDLAMTSIRQKPIKLSDFNNAKAIVIAFTNASCPICKKYTPTLAKIEAAYDPDEVAFVYVNPTSSDKQSSIEKVIADQGLDGPYVRDENNAIAAALGATRTTDVFVLDADRTLIYRGAVDDQYGFGYSRDEPKANYLIAAIDAVLKSSRPRVQATEAPGCPLEVKQTTTDDSVGVTYHHQIARIFQNHCVQCHREDGVGPFPLEDFASVEGQGGAIRRVIEQDLMPPWFAARPKDNSPSAFINDCSLSPNDKAMVLKWLDSGKPEGNPADSPRRRTFASEWQIGAPDLVLQLPQPIAVKASGTMPYQEVTIETGFTEDKFVSALEVMPTAREVVHHCLVFVLPPASGDGGERDRRVGGDERDGFFAAYAPGYDALQFNDGFGKVIPAGSRLKFQLHYTPNGSATEDQTKIGMVFASRPPEHLVNVTGIAQPRLAIPPHADNHEVTASVKVPHDATLLAFFPHMHLRGKAFRYEAIAPDGTKQTLLDIPRYDFNWQLSYRLAEPLRLSAGTTIVATAWYDNSENNPANPDPDRTVTWGQQTYDEMMIGYIEYHSEEGRVRRSPNGPVSDALRNLGNGQIIAAKFKQLDTNADQRLSREELPAGMRERLMALDADRDSFLSLEEAKKLKDVVTSRP